MIIIGHPNLKLVKNNYNFKIKIKIKFYYFKLF